MPAILATLTADLMITLAKDSEVEMIYPAEAEEKPLLLDSGKTHRFESVWNAGTTGAGQTIAILESANVWTGNTYLNYSPDLSLEP